MANEGVMMSLDVWRKTGMQECTQSFSACSEVDRIAFNMSAIAEGNFHEDICVSNASLFGINSKSQAYVEIVEEPPSDGIKFRYEKEKRLSSRIVGVNSTKTLKTFPTMKIHGYQGAAYVVASLVSLGPPYYPHPHKLVGKSCKNGVCVKQIDNPEMICSFFNLRIQCVKRKDVKASLAEREALQVDPFRTGFSHSDEPKKINYNAIRLCFQVFLPDSNGQFNRPLDPVLSTPIGNKTVCDLSIMRLSHCSAPVSGKEEVILLCGQVRKDDIEIVFYEENEDKKIIWIAKGEFSPDDVHCKVAISFKTPAYINPNIQKPVKCFVFLRRPSDGIKGKPREFTLYPSKRGAVNQPQACNVPVNQLDPLASASVVTKIRNYEYASSYYSEQLVSTASSEYVAIQQNIHQNINANPVDELMESLSADLSELTIGSITEAARIGLIGGKFCYGQNLYQVNMREEDICPQISANTAYQIDFNSNESCANLSGMTIDSFTETAGLISVGLIDGKISDEQLY